MFLSNRTPLGERSPYDIIFRILQRLKCILPSCFLHPCTAAMWTQVPWNVSKILWETNAEWKNEEPISLQELIDIVKTAWFKEEPMRTLDGKIILKELLINFWNIPAEHRKTIFPELKKHPDGTFLLFCLSLEAAKEQILRWEAVSINAFVEDFDHPDFLETMLAFLSVKWADPSLLTIELLEDHEHTVIVPSIIKMIRALEQGGIKIAIDDYSFLSEKYSDSQNRSILIMSSLIENDIPFRIKIDGGIVSALFPIEWHRNMDGNSMKDHYPSLYDEQRANLRNTIISEIKNCLEAWIIVVLEWVIPAQLSILRETFWSTKNADTHLLVQGMELWDEDFREEK